MIKKSTNKLMEKLKKEIQSVVDIYKSGNLDKAEILTRKLINNNKKIVFLYNLLGLILVDQGKKDQAMECYEEGIKIDPSYAMIYNNIGLLFFKKKTENNLIKAENFYKKAIALDKNLVEAYNNLGSLYDFLDNYNEAIDCYIKAININPNFSYAHHNLGSAYVTIGKFAEAKKHFKESIKLNPNFVDTHQSLSRITKYTKTDEHFEELKKIYKNINTNDKIKKITIGFSLGKAYEDMNDFEKSFNHFNEANYLQRQKINFSTKLEKEKFEDTKKIYNKKLFKKYKNSGCNSTSPIFIVGMPRSGTTLVEQIISSHPNVFGADELEFIPNLIEKNFGDKNLRLFFDGVENFDEANFKKIGDDYINKVEKLSDNSQKITDKLPINFLYIGFIKLILPNSKIIHCYRNPKDNCLSLFKNYFRGKKITFAYDIDEIVQYYNFYKDLMNHWINLLPDFIYEIKYENLINNTKSEINKLLINCDLNWNEDCLNFDKNKKPIKTASDYQARNKIYNTSINSWKNYEKYFAKHFINLEN